MFHWCHQETEIVVLFISAIPIAGIYLKRFVDNLLHNKSCKGE
jgi:hypothetical protein